MESYKGSIDFTVICRLWRDHRELFNLADFRDGQHALLYVTLHERKEPDDKGNTHYLQADCKKADRKDGVNYYIGSRFKPAKPFSTGEVAATQESNVEGEGELPF